MRNLFKSESLRKESNILLTILFLFYSILLQFSIQSIVLCFGEDGHVAFEQADENFHCIDYVESNESINMSIIQQIDLSDECQDLPLISNTLRIYNKKDIIPIFTTLNNSFTIKNKLNSASDQHRNLKDNKNSINYTNLKNLRSTILMI